MSPGVRGWPAWLGLWSAGAVGLLFALATPEALSLLPEARRYGDQVTATDGAIATIPLLAAVLLPFVVGLACWRRRPRVTRGCLVLCAAGLAGAALTVRGIPDVGPWSPWALGVAAAVALLGAVLGTGAVDEPSRVARALVSSGLVLVGAVVVVLAWRGLDYQDWHWRSTALPMVAALATGTVLVLLGLAGTRLPDSRWTAAPALVLLVAAASVTLLWAGAWMLALPFLDRHEESESAWMKLAELLVGVGLLAGAAAVARRWWSTAGLSVVGGCAAGAAVVARTPDLWRLMW
jgi:hypothetical protein